MRQIVNIQGLRAIAVLLVIAAHEHDFLDRFGVHSIFRTFTVAEAWGVDLFFVISGCVMITVHAGDFGVPKAPLRFILRRALRIFPIYWLVTLFIYAIFKMVPSQLHTWPTSGANLALSLALLVPLGSPVLLFVGWTLVFEMYFYYAFAAMLSFPRRIALAIAGIWAALLIVLQFVHVSSDPWFLTLTNGLVLEFALGMFVGALVIRRRFLTTPLALAAVVGAIVLLTTTFRIAYDPVHELHADAPLRFLSVGVPMALLLYGAVSLELRGAFVAPQPFQKIGDASYSIYLTHPVFYVALGRVVSTVFHNTAPGLVLIVIGPIVVILGGCAAYRWIERPLLQLIRAWAKRAFPVAMGPLRTPIVAIVTPASS